MTARRGAWGDYAGGDSPGLSLHTTPWLHQREIAAVATDTWGAEVRPNEIDVFQPFHLVGLVHMGLAIGEIFDLDGQPTTALPTAATHSCSPPHRYRSQRPSGRRSRLSRSSEQQADS
jgi:hypothetical protein